MSAKAAVSRRTVVAVIGSASGLSSEVLESCEALGAGLMARGYRLVTGGLGGVMEAVSKGARGSEHWEEGRVVGVLPSYDATTANLYVDIVIPSGMQLARNTLVVSMADVVVAVAGGSGTLSEMALAWQLGKPIVALTETGGWARELGGEVLDHRNAQAIEAAASVDEALELVGQVAAQETLPPGDIGSGSRRGG